MSILNITLTSGRDEVKMALNCIYQVIYKEQMLPIPITEPIATIVPLSARCCIRGRLIDLNLKNNTILIDHSISLESKITEIKIENIEDIHLLHSYEDGIHGK